MPALIVHQHFSELNYIINMVTKNVYEDQKKEKKACIPTSQKLLKTKSAAINSCMLEVLKMILSIEFRAGSTCGSSPRNLLERTSQFFESPAIRSPIHLNA